VQAWLFNLGIIGTNMEPSTDSIICVDMNAQTHLGFVMYVHV